MRHPDADRPTVRIPFDQLRALVISLIEEDLETAELEFETQPTTYALNRPRVSTLDALIASLPPRRA
jgi:hypothetical protein